MRELNLKFYLLKEIKKKGGFVNAHAHFDRAFTLCRENFKFVNCSLSEKWQLVDQLKRDSTVDQIYDRMAKATELMIAQNVQAVGTFIDVDEVIKDKAIKAGERLRERYQSQIKIKFINQVLKGVVDKKARFWFNLASEFVDIIGGLPAKDKGREEEHLDIIFDTAKKMKKMVHVHVDQLNNSKEKETELLIKKAVKYQYQGKVVAIHCISLAAHPKKYRQKIYKKMKEAGVMVISCPSAWIDSRRSEELSPTHNSVTPVDEMIPEKITVALGTDNIEDIYKPFSDGDMWMELRFLLESCRFYDLDQLVNIATVNGLKVLGIKKLS